MLLLMLFKTFKSQQSCSEYMMQQQNCLSNCWAPFWYWSWSTNQRLPLSTEFQWSRQSFIFSGKKQKSICSYFK